MAGVKNMHSSSGCATTSVTAGVPHDDDDGASSSLPPQGHGATARIGEGRPGASSVCRSASTRANRARIGAAGGGSLDGGAGRRPAGWVGGGRRDPVGVDRRQAMADARDDDEIAMEQEMELEALEAILMDDLCELSADEARDVGCEGDLRCFRITIHAVEDPEPDSFPPVLGMVFAHTPRYPDAPPFVKVDSISGLTDGDLAEVREAVTAQIEHGLGEAVIFDLVTCAKECMQARLADAGGGDGKGDGGKDAAEQAAREEEERRARARASGTPVTPESFRTWSEAFEREQAALLGPSALAVAASAGKLTGKQFFLSAKDPKVALASALGWEEGDDDGDDDGEGDDVGEEAVGAVEGEGGGGDAGD